MLETVPEGMKSPSEVEFRPSEIEPTLMGVWAKRQIKKGRTYGPFVGEKRKCIEVTDDTYSWEIKGPRGVRLYSVDASDPSKANWMRFVKSARSYDEQNMIATQYKKNIYYQTLRPIIANEELLCWYKNAPAEKASTEGSDGVLNTSGDSNTSSKSEGDSFKSEGDQFERQMPILEKMDPSDMIHSNLDSAMSAESENGAKVPTHLDVFNPEDLDDKVAEPPLISPIFPSNGQHAAAFASITAGVDLGGVGDPVIQIQAPDISSSDATSNFLSITDDAMESNDADTTSATDNADVAKVAGSKKKSKAELKRQLKAQGGVVKKRMRVGQKITSAPKGGAKAKTSKEDQARNVNDDESSVAIIGPDCVSVGPDGTDVYCCQFCPKKCRFPNGLKLHLMLKHHIRKITVEGVDTSKWGKGLGPGDIKHRKRKPVATKPKDVTPPPKEVKENKVVEKKPSKPSKTPNSVKKSPENKSKKGTFICHLCNRPFMYATWRDKHLLRHKADESKETFLCSDCPRRFVTEGDLTKHMLSHKTKAQAQEQVGIKTEIEPSVQAEQEAVESLPQQQTNQAAEDYSAKTTVAVSSENLDIHMESPVDSSDIDYRTSDSQDNAKRRNVTNRKGMLKKVAACKICGIQFVSSSNLHRHLRRRHGQSIPGRKPVPLSPPDSEAVRKETPTEPKAAPVAAKPEPTVKTSETVLNVPKVNPVQTKGHMKTMANMTRLIRRKHATAVLQNMILEKKFGGEGSGKDQTKMRAKLHAALRQGKNHSKRPHQQQQGFKRIEQIAIKHHKEVHGVICPWQNSVKPNPYVPTKPRSSTNECNHPGPSTSSMEVLDLRVKKPRREGSQKPSSVPYVVDPSQPLDLTCHSRPVVQAPVRKRAQKPPKMPKVPIHFADSKTITRINITPRMKSTGWKSSTLSTATESLNQERSTKFSVLDAAIMCNVCELPFDSMKLLTQHVVAHAEDYPYKCEFCVKLFETTDMLASHRYGLHRVGKMYCCSECQQEFAYLSNLNNHQEDMHPDVPCSYTERGPEEIRPQNFTDPTKAIQPHVIIIPEPKERISLIAQEMRKAKVTPAKYGRFNTQETKAPTPKKQSTKKDVPCNPQRHHPFAYAREIGYLSTRTDNKDSKDNKQEEPKTVTHFEMATNNRCTKCSRVFSSTADLHVHIMECASAYTAPTEVKAKTPAKTPSKTPVKTSVVIPVKSAEKKQKTGSVRKLKMQAAKRSRKRAVLKANESEESDTSKRKRARPGLKMYNPLNHTRRRASANIDDTHACQGCGKKFHFINGLERHMKLCPNKDKLFKKNPNPYIAPQIMNHQCAYCARQFVYLRSLKKHISSCPKRPAGAPTSVPSLIVPTAASSTFTTAPTSVATASQGGVQLSSHVTTVSATATSSGSVVASVVTETTPKSVPKATTPNAKASGSNATATYTDAALLEQLAKKAIAESATSEVNDKLQPMQGARVNFNQAEQDKEMDTGTQKEENGEASMNVTPRKPRRKRRRRSDPYGKKRRPRSNSPRGRPNVEEVAGEAEDEDESEYEDEDAGADVDREVIEGVKDQEVIEGEKEDLQKAEGEKEDLQKAEGQTGEDQEEQVPSEVTDNIEDAAVDKSLKQDDSVSAVVKDTEESNENTGEKKEDVKEEENSVKEGDQVTITKDEAKESVSQVCNEEENGVVNEVTKDEEIESVHQITKEGDKESAGDEVEKQP